MVIRKLVAGYFTTEDNVRGLDTDELERRLGFRAGRLHAGARIWILERKPVLGEFETHGSTRVPGGVGLDHARIEATRSVPGAWHHRRLVKVEPLVPHGPGEEYPAARGVAAEQWRLKRPCLARLARQLAGGETWWGE